MRLNKYFDNKEVSSLLGASIILGFIISFKSWGYEEFSLSVGLANWIRAFLLSFIVFAIYLVANKNAAKLHGAKTTFRIWNIERYWFSRESRFSRLNFFGFKIFPFKSFKVGLFIPILFSIFSNGAIKVAAIGHTDITEVSSQRAGKKYEHLTDFEMARIHLAGPMATLLLTILLSSFSSFSTLTEIAKLVTIYSFIPFSKMDGAKVLFGSLPLYIFALIFTIVSLLLLTILGTIATLALALVVAIIMLLIYLYKSN